MKKTFLLLTIAIILCSTAGIIACNKIKNDKGIIVRDMDFGTCLQPQQSGAANEWVIRTQAEYDSLLARAICPVNVETIDFSQYSLLGKYTEGQCHTKFYRQVLQDDNAKTIRYSLLVKSHGNCKTMAFNYNWVLIPKIPEGYAVTFSVKNK